MSLEKTVGIEDVQQCLKWTVFILIVFILYDRQFYEK